MKNDVYIFGAGGFGREVLSMLRALPSWNVVGFVDDGIPAGYVVNGVKVIGGIDAVKQFQGKTTIILAIGDPSLKKKIVTTLADYPVCYPRIVHPSATIQDPESVVMGEGVILCAGVVITTNIKIGSHVLINLNTTVGHDCSIGNFTSVMPGVNIAGNVRIDEGVLIGSGANVRNHVRLRDRCVVGMGSVVLHDVEVDNVVAGVPAKTIRK